MLTDLITTASRKQLMAMMLRESPRLFVDTIINELQDSKTIWIDQVWANRIDRDYDKLRLFDSTIKKYEDILSDMRSLVDDS